MAYKRHDSWYNLYSHQHDFETLQIRSLNSTNLIP